MATTPASKKSLIGASLPMTDAPLLLPQATEWLAGRRYSRELVERGAHAAIALGKPLTTSALTPVYRREMLRVFTRRALEQAWQDHIRSDAAD
jgi:CO/xanthine dehydrogenase FAD-binding subunit